MADIILTEEGVLKLEEELRYLKFTKRPEIAEKRLRASSAIFPKTANTMLHRMNTLLRKQESKISKKRLKTLKYSTSRSLPRI